MALDKYGHFSADGKEFIITQPDTPAPWINYISNGSYSGLVSNTGGGYSYYLDPRDSRITRLRYNSLPWDRPGRYVYAKKDDGTYWSLTWQPTGHKLDDYECRVGMGYQTIRTRAYGFSSEVTYFVPLEDNLEVWMVKVRNETGKKEKLSLYGYVELCLGHALVDLINQPNDQHFNHAYFDRDLQAIVATKNYWVTYRSATVKQPNVSWDRNVFFATNLATNGWDCHKDTFIGKWRSESNPQGIENGTLSGSDITAGDACAALASEITLEAGEEKEFVFLLGCTPKTDGTEAIDKHIKKYTDTEICKEKRRELDNWWDEYLSSVTVKTEDEDIDRLVNVWGKRQSWVTYNMNRNAGYYHGGLLFGVGMRDQCQDMMGPLLSEKCSVRARLLEVTGRQFEDGSTLHNYFKITGEGEKTGHSDTPLWLPFAVIIYIKETGETDILKEIVPYFDGNSADVLTHATKAVDYVLSTLTKNRLPLFGPGDWNDTLDYVGRKGTGESVWVAEFLCYILKEMVGLLEYLSTCPDFAGSSLIKACLETYTEEYTLIAKAVNERTWDGKWYIRGLKDDGGVIGSDSCAEGKIFWNAQSWAVISGIADTNRAESALEYAHEMCMTERGPKLLHPAYRTLDPTVGLATRCVPGKKENAAIFNHVSAWAILANAIFGYGDRAYDYLKRTMPQVQAKEPDVYKMEPYVYSEYVTSNEHTTFGEASHSWLTGSGVWMFRTALDYILGVRPTYEGLVIDPCIPSQWKTYTVRRKFRGAIYNITVNNPHNIQKGFVSLEVDGVKIDGNICPETENMDEVNVICTMLTADN